MITNIQSENIILEDERVLLRPLTSGDYGYLLPFAVNEPDLWQYSLVSPAGAEGLREYIALSMKNKIAGNEYPFIVFDKKTNAYAGSTRFYDIQPAFQSSQLGYTWYGEKFQRTGLNRHCKFLLLQFAFEQWGLERIEFRANADNKKSIDSMKAIGCIVEGILRSNIPTRNGSRRNSIVLSILKDEWFGNVKEALKKKIYS